MHHVYLCDCISIYLKQRVRALIEELEESGAERMPELLSSDPGPLPGNLYRTGFLNGMR
jgi:hypothetical protein